MTPSTPPDLAASDSNPPDHHETHDVQGLHAAIVREQSDPRDGFEPIPTWLAAVFGVLVFFAGTYFQKYSADLRPDVLEGDWSKIAPGGAAKSKAPLDPIALGKKLYAAQGCVSCHTAGGTGQEGQIPPLAKSEWVLGSPARINRILLNGLQGPIEVAGKSYNNNMPAFGAKLKDAEIAAVLSYIRSDWGNAAAPVPTESVAAAREASKPKSDPWTSAELKQITKEDAAQSTTKDASKGSTGEAEKNSGKKADTVKPSDATGGDSSGKPSNTPEKANPPKS